VCVCVYVCFYISVYKYMYELCINVCVFFFSLYTTNVPVFACMCLLCTGPTTAISHFFFGNLGGRGEERKNIPHPR